jgi:hypothetical protein
LGVIEGAEYGHTFDVTIFEEPTPEKPQSMNAEEVVRSFQNLPCPAPRRVLDSNMYGTSADLKAAS